MTKKSQAGYPEVVVSSKETTLAVSRAVAQGKLRKLGSRLYTSNLNDLPEEIVRRNVWPIVAGYFPGALIADRTALEMLPAADGSVYIVADSKNERAVPGLVIRPRPGSGPLSDDSPFLNGLYLSSTTRAYLENMVPTRARRGRVSRTLGERGVEEKLERLIGRTDETEINRLRDEAIRIAPLLGLENEAKRLADLVGALLGTRETSLRTGTGKARRLGKPYDVHRLELFQKLHGALRAEAPRSRPRNIRSTERESIVAFFESYFSNFIEGTEFTLEEAEKIVFEGHMPTGRPRDAHDILGTYRLAIAPVNWHPDTANAIEFIAQLKAFNAEIMGARPEMNPGTFKTRANQAGSTRFVEPELVEGTLRQGHKLLSSLDTPFQRAVFAMFLVAEIHPFDDGNGRTARIMMNSELRAAGEERIVIPTVYRDNYISALKALTHNRNPNPLIRVLDYAWRWTAAIDWRDLKEATTQLHGSNAFADGDDDVRLRLPDMGP